MIISVSRKAWAPTSFLQNCPFYEITSGTVLLVCPDAVIIFFTLKEK